MKSLVRILAFSLFLSLPAWSQAPPPVWQAVAQPAFDTSKTAQVSNLVLDRDAIKITLTSGVIQFAQPVEGRVFAASFRGSGVLQVEPPNAVEAQQLRFFTGQTEMRMEFTEAVFSFTDATFDEVAAKVQWGGAADAALQRNYQDRTSFREDYGAGLVPRLVKGVLSANRQRTELFFAEVKTGDKGWVFAQMDALNPEQISVGRWQNYGPLRIADLWMSFPRGKRTAAEAWSVPTALEDVPPDNYEISATVTTGAELRAVARFEIKPQWAGERLLNFVLDSNLRATSVKNAGSGQALTFVQPAERKDRIQSYGDYISVFLPEPLAAGEAVKLEIEYAGKRVVRSMGPGVYFCQSFGWYPTRDNFALRSNFHMTFRSPRRYSFVATGQKISETTDGGDLVTEWKSEKPIAVAGFAFGEVKVEKTTAGEVEIEIYANRQPDDQMREILRITEGGMADGAASSAARESSGAALGNMSPAAMAGQIATDMSNSLKLFENYFGPYPYKRLAVSTIPYSYGQGWPTLIYLSALSFMDSFQRKQFGFSQRAEKSITDFFRAHEISHQWWGHKVAWKSYHDQWLSEGFAEFSGNLYLQLRSGHKEYIDRLQQTRLSILNKDDKNRRWNDLGPIWMGLRLRSSETMSTRSPSINAYNILVYEKGGFVLHMLRMMLYDAQNQDPDHRFKAMMRDFTATYDNKAASTEDFKAVAEKHMIRDMNLDGNARLDWFFNQYVYGTGIPTYDFKYTVTDAGNGQWKLSGTVTQSDVPEGWKDVLPLYLEINKQMYRVGTMNIMKKVTTFEEVLPVKPDEVALCVHEDNIGNIKQ